MGGDGCTGGDGDVATEMLTGEGEAAVAGAGGEGEQLEGDGDPSTEPLPLRVPCCARQRMDEAAGIKDEAEAAAGAAATDVMVVGAPACVAERLVVELSTEQQLMDAVLASGEEGVLQPQVSDAQARCVEPCQS